MKPLADRIRPLTLTSLVGQSHITANEGLITQILKSPDTLPSLIFWGPPGTGKTTLAQIIANTTNRPFISISAVLSGVKDIREIIKQYQNQSPVVFIDEIHRFNKSQQDILLPHIENGTITLIGATTENPSFELNNALLSRCKVITLERLKNNELIEILINALNDSTHGLAAQHTIADEQLALIAELADGDARRALNILELANHLASTQQHTEITKNDIQTAAQKKLLSYDRAGENHYNIISAFIKSMRASDINAALYYLARMIEAGEDPKFIARRMVIFASEDIGIAQPTSLVVATAAFNAVSIIGLPEAAINLAHAVVQLCLAPKNRQAYDAYAAALADVKQYGDLEVPLHIRNAPTKLMKDLGYGQGYTMYPQNKSHLPDQIENHQYYNKTK